MTNLIIKLTDLKSKAELYMNKRNQIMRNIGCGMMEVINELEPFIHQETTPEKVQALLVYHREKILQEGECEGVKRDMELRYDGVKLCEGICDGGRTNKEYFDRVMKSLVNEGYDEDKFNIIIGNQKYIQ
jgi:hypothetical protein